MSKCYQNTIITLETLPSWSNYSNSLLKCTRCRTAAPRDICSNNHHCAQITASMLNLTMWPQSAHLSPSFQTKFVQLGRRAAAPPRRRGTFLVYTISSWIEIMYPHLILLLRIMHAFWSLLNKFQMDIYFMGPFIMTSSQAEPQMSPILGTFWVIT